MSCNMRCRSQLARTGSGMDIEKRRADLDIRGHKLSAHVLDVFVDVRELDPALA
jgi:hypothetical protein